MGRLISPPKVPEYVAPAPQPVTLPPSTPTQAELDKQASAKAAEEAEKKAAEAKQKEEDKKEQENLLTRARRGRSSTVKTSFRGLLETNKKTPERKSLLGE